MVVGGGCGVAGMVVVGGVGCGGCGCWLRGCCCDGGDNDNDKYNVGNHNGNHTDNPNNYTDKY